MKPPIDERLNEALDLELVNSPAQKNNDLLPPNSPAAPIATIPDVITAGNAERDMEDDFTVVRKTLHHLNNKGNELVEDANYFARERQDARSVEAASMAQREARENALALINAHKAKKEIERLNAPSGGDTTITQNNAAVFVGTMGDALKQIREMNTDGLLRDALRTITVEPEQKALNSGADPKQE